MLLKLYGPRGIELTGFLGGLVNSTVVVSELSARVHETVGQLVDVAYRGIVLAVVAMLVRNAVLLGIFAPLALWKCIVPLVLMLFTTLVCVLRGRPRANTQTSPAQEMVKLESPFSLQSALRFGALFVALQLLGVMAQQTLGTWGVYAISLIGGLFSSASAVASAAELAARGTIGMPAAGIAAIIASGASVAVNLPLVLRAHDAQLTRRLCWALGLTIVAGLMGIALQLLF